ncbi:MAG: heme exporter protein CcmD [Phenylobacterium sp.]|uniref:heme exporter protein CcmD n=1 Tax=Phenylobacterium sp. TaxID=1871053 RepID=UPI00391B7C88
MLDFDAGKYAAFVWPAFAVTVVVFAAMVADSLALSRRWRKRAEELNARRR